MSRLHPTQLVHARSAYLRPAVCPILGPTRSACRLLTVRAERNDSQASVVYNVNTGFLLASVCASLIAASGALAADSTGYQQSLQQQQVLEVVQESAHVSEQESSSNKWARSNTPFDVALASVISLADTLSQATCEFVDLTEAAQAADLNKNGTSYVTSSSSMNASFTAQPTYQLMNRHREAVNEIAASGQLNPAALNSASNPSQEAYMGVASRMSQHAMAVAGEALRLATLLDSHGKGMDPSYHSLLQQIIEAANSVSAVAADIAQPGNWVVDDASGSSHVADGQEVQ